MKYDVIIAGGGPVGAALAIELGINNIKVLVLEKYQEPLKTPRAQSLSARSMEFFKRWGIDKKLEKEILFSPNYPQKGVWCSTLNGKAYFSALCSDNKLAANASPKEAIRIPLWLTEKVLRHKLADLPTVTMLRGYELQQILPLKDGVEVVSFDNASNKHYTHKAKFLACCDGAKGPSKRLCGIKFQDLSDITNILSISFFSMELQNIKKVEDGIFYGINTQEVSGFLSPIDLKKGRWLAQVVLQENKLPSKEEVSYMLDKMAGESFSKEVKEFHNWQMQVQIADKFSLNNRIFWLGDAAHAFAPTGGLGLNTGFGDAQNLGWKLAEVINYKQPIEYLASYEKERYPIWQNNLNFAKKNADDLMKIKKQYLQDNNYEEFVLANAKLGKQFLDSSRLTMGYNYCGLENNINYDDINNFKYEPKCEHGYFIPNVLLDSKISIHNLLAPNKWNLIVLREDKLPELPQKISKDRAHQIKVPQSAYPGKSIILLRPDWHIDLII